MTACPSCFQQLPADVYAWICQNPQCEKTHDPVASSFLGSSTLSGNMNFERKPADAPRRWAPSQVKYCGRCPQPQVEACPTCHYALPPDWRSNDVTTIAMNGARATGKSFYIAVVIQQLEVLLGKLGSTFDFGNDRTRDVYQTVYEKPLYEQMGIIAPTPRANTDNSYQRDPMIFSLGMLRGRPRYLAIRDVAGEEMENAAADAPNLSFLRHADSVFFMFDPLAITEIRDRLRDLVPQQLYRGGDPKVVLGNLLRLTAGSSTRIAVIVSKFDALQALARVNDVDWKAVMSNPGAAYQRDPSLDKGEYDSADGELLHLEVRSLLHKLGAQNFVLSLEQANRGTGIDHRFFAVSVLGESPDGESLSHFGISPFRIVDPLKWILASRDVI
jgi:hypothetical protein